MKKAVIIMLCIAIPAMCIAAVYCDRILFRENEEPETEPEAGFGMFSWQAPAVSPDESAAMLACIDTTGVSEVYQFFSQESLTADGYARAFVTGLQEKRVAVYALVGEAEWAYDADGARLIESMQNVAEYNQTCQSDAEKICGIVADVEPYLLDEWRASGEERAELMENYLRCMSSAYQYAAQNALEFTVCVPTFYNSSCQGVLESLVAGACDRIAVMNYNRTDEYGQIAHEVGLAREYEKRIICIYELQEPGRHDLEDINTYANEGLEALKDSAARLDKQFGYDGLQFAYHWYEPLKKLSGVDD